MLRNRTAAKNRIRAARMTKARQPQTPQQQAQPQEQPQEQPQQQPQEQPQPVPQDAQPQEQFQEQPQEQFTNSEEQQPAEEDSFDGEENSPVIHFPLVSSHVRDNKMHTSAISLSPAGCFLVHCASRCRGDNGPIVGHEPKSPTVRRALSAHASIITDKVQSEKQKQYAGELVERSRQGDQNAMGMICAIRDNVKTGNPRARQSFQLLKEYIDKNPVTPNIGEDRIPSSKQSNEHWQSTMIANGPLLTKSRIQRVKAALGTDAQTFMRSFARWREKESLEHENIIMRLDAVQKQLSEIGRILGQAFAIQSVRQPNSEISKYNLDAGWELGE